MKNTLTKLLFLSFVTIGLMAAKCDSVDKDYSSDDPSSVCDYIMDKCNNLYDSKAECEEDVATMDKCRAECALNQSSCEIMDQCLWWAGGYDGEVDNYCSGDDSGSNDSYSDIDGCAAVECPAENATCESNPQCVGIFEDCYNTCADIACLSNCAETYYPGGITDHDNLFTCLTTRCSDYI